MYRPFKGAEAFMKQCYAELHARIVSALAEADALGLAAVGIELDQARVRLEELLYPKLSREAGDTVVLN